MVIFSKVSTQPASAQDFWPLKSQHFLSILRYHVQFLSLWSFVDCGFWVRVIITVRVSVNFFFIFPSPCMLKQSENYHQVDCLRSSADLSYRKCTAEIKKITGYFLQNAL